MKSIIKIFIFCFISAFTSSCSTQTKKPIPENNQPTIKSISSNELKNKNSLPIYKSKESKTLSNKRIQVKTDPLYHEHRFVYAKDCILEPKHTHILGNTKHIHKYGVNCRAFSKANKTQKIDVKKLQARLKAKGYYKGPINGVVSTQTRKALRKYMDRKK